MRLGIQLEATEGVAREERREWGRWCAVVEADRLSVVAVIAIVLLTSGGTLGAELPKPPEIRIRNPARPPAAIFAPPKLFAALVTARYSKLAPVPAASSWRTASPRKVARSPILPALDDGDANRRESDE